MYTSNQKNRIKIYNKLIPKISYLSNNDIKKLLNNSKNKTKGWGENFIINIDNHKIFVKAIKLTQLEYNNMFNTSNLFKLPVFCNYGVGSVGINVWRELLIHIKTTHYVLNNMCDSFPLLYHYRIVEYTPTNTIYYDKKYIQSWNSNLNIKKYLDEKNKTKYKILLFLEYIPYTLWKLIIEIKQKNLNYYYQIQNIIKFLNDHNILHFDVHAGNLLVDDNNKIYLSDFGLVMDLEFKLTNTEITFFNYNKDIDKLMICMTVLFHIFNIIFKNKMYQKILKFDKNTKDDDVIEIVKNNYELILNKEKIKYDNDVKNIINNGFSMYNFLEKLRRSNTKKVLYS